MLDVGRFREDADGLAKALARRGGEFPVSEVVRLDAARRDLVRRLEALRTERNRISEAVGRAKREGRVADAEVERAKAVGEEIAEIEARRREVEAELEEMLLEIPNVPADDVPEGGAENNRVVKVVGEPRTPPGGGRPHWEIAESLGFIDFARGVKVAKTRFYCLVGRGAELERALISFMLDKHTREHGYTEVFPPFLVNRDAMIGTGQFPKFEDEYFTCERDGLSLIPTAEVPVTNLYRDEILREEDLPIAHCAYTACFRREAGAAGKETRGVLRVHQFNKVELVRFVRPEDSDEELEKLTSHAEAVLEDLGLPYRRVLLAAGDLGFSAAKTYDLEVWMPGQNRWVEVSSCSNFTDYQARRMKIRCRGEAAGGRKPKTRFVHTLNGSGLAVGRTWAAILENFLQPDGSVRIPEVLQK